jgi:hypothetical protein
MNKETLKTVDETLSRFDDEQESIELAPHETSLDFLRKVYRSVRQPMSRRMRAAIEALQHEHPRLQATATANMSGQDFASVLERAIQRSLAGKPIKLIETQAVEVEEVGR